MPHDFIWFFISDPSLHIRDKITYIISHLRGACRSAIIIVNKPVIKLSRHPYDHMIEIRVEVFSLRYVHPICRLKMVARQNIINIVNFPRPQSDFCKIGWVDSSVGILGFILG